MRKSFLSEVNLIHKAVFLDLQGTLGGEGLGDIRDFSFFPFSYEAIKLLNASSLLAIIVTNQSHIGKGCFSFKEYEQRVKQLKKTLQKRSLHVDGWYCCPHTKQDACSCKKPLPGLLFQAKRDLEIRLEESYVVGDMGVTDMLLADAVDAKGVLVRTGVGGKSLTEFRYTWKHVTPVYIAKNVLDAVQWILEEEKYGG
ncbi:MAG: HAD-IIIA family hydrolase [Candidatus Korarchaeota archaeon]|nr:HAD-IIIA family hydrolase [Candidatus Korarchaeota archaeon]NIW13452.1 HAD-IIIA family hydrolase [Candidatus Thorarchaeota archaeon]